MRVRLGIDVHCDIPTKHCEQNVDLYVTAGDIVEVFWNYGCNNIRISNFILQMSDILTYLLTYLLHGAESFLRS